MVATVGQAYPSGHTVLETDPDRQYSPATHSILLVGCGQYEPSGHSGFALLVPDGQYMPPVQRETTVGDVHVKLAGQSVRAVERGGQ